MRLNTMKNLIKSITFYVVLVVSMPLFSQKTSEEGILLKKAGELIFSSPDESLKIGNHLLKKEGSDEMLAEVNLVMAESYSIKGDYNNLVKHVFEAGKRETAISDSLKIRILLLKARVAGNLYLDNQWEGYVKQAQAIAESSGRKDFEVNVGFEKVRLDIVRHKYKEALQLLQDMEKTYAGIIAADSDLKLRNAIAKGMAYNGEGINEAAGKNLNDAIKIYQDEKSTNILYKVYIYYGFGDFNLQQKDYAKAIDNFRTALADAERTGNKMLLREIKHQLSICYLAINDRVLCRQYNNEFSDLLVSVENMEIEAVNTFYGLIVEEQDIATKSQENRYWDYTFLIIGIFAAIIVFGGGLFYVNILKKRRLKEIMSYLELINNTAVIKPQADKREAHKKLVIPTETEQHILAKLKKFEASVKYTHKDMSLANLASQLDVNTKYLSEIINKHYQDNFNTYINKLRINYIIEKLKNHPEYLHYKISYLAEESGFSSHSSFATVFKSITGIAPTTFIELMGEEVKDKQKII